MGVRIVRCDLIETGRDRSITNITSAREGLKKIDRIEGKRERKRHKERMNASLFSSQINKASSCLSDNEREREIESTQCVEMEKIYGHSKTLRWVQLNKQRNGEKDREGHKVKGGEERGG